LEQSILFNLIFIAQSNVELSMTQCYERKDQRSLLGYIG